MSKTKLIALAMWGIASVFYAYQYILRVMPNIMLNDIMVKFDIDTVIFGQFSGIYYIGYTLVHLPMGIMLDRFGPRLVMTLCILLTVLGLLPIIYSDNFIYPIMGRFIIGIGSSAAILSAFKIIRMGFEEKYFTRMLSLTVTIGLIGAIYGGSPVSEMCNDLGYELVTKIFAASGTVLALISFLLIPDIKTNNESDIISDIKLVFTNKKVLFLCISAGLMVGPIEGFADVWGAQFLKINYGFDVPLSSYLTSMIFVGMCFGAPFLSLIAEKTGAYMGAIICAGTLMCIIFTALIFNLMNLDTMTIGFVIVGVCCAYQIIAIYKASTYVPEHVAGLTNAVANMIIMSFGYAFHTVIGIIIKSFNSYIYGISIIPIALSIGILGFIIISISDYKIKHAQ